MENFEAEPGSTAERDEGKSLPGDGCGHNCGESSAAAMAEEAAGAEVAEGAACEPSEKCNAISDGSKPDNEDDASPSMDAEPQDNGGCPTKLEGKSDVPK